MYLGACDNIIIGNAFIFYGENLGLIMLIVLSYALLEIMDNISKYSVPLHNIDIRASR